MIVKMIQELGKRMEAKIEKMQEMFNKDLTNEEEIGSLPEKEFRIMIGKTI